MKPGGINFPGLRDPLAPRPIATGSDDEDGGVLASVLGTGQGGGGKGGNRGAGGKAKGVPKKRDRPAEDKAGHAVAPSRPLEPPTAATSTDDFFAAMSVKDTAEPVQAVSSTAAQRAWWRMCDRRRILIADNADLWNDLVGGGSASLDSFVESRASALLRKTLPKGHPPATGGGLASKHLVPPDDDVEGPTPSQLAVGPVTAPLVRHPYTTSPSSDGILISHLLTCQGKRYVPVLFFQPRNGPVAGKKGQPATTAAAAAPCLRRSVDLAAIPSFDALLGLLVGIAGSSAKRTTVEMLERNGSVLLSAATAHPLPPPLGDAMADGDDPHAPAVAARAKWLDACVAVHRIAVHMMG